ncbi:MAG: lactate utilization protein [Pirellulales bacterium]|nr:lactate utilization protein [Pirellulales bacterium]
MSHIARHPELAAQFVSDGARTEWHDQALWFVRKKRDQMAHALPEWELLREKASQIKHHTMSHLDQYLLQFETKAIERGAQIHWARNAEEHNTIVLGILQEHHVTRLVKSKSMLTEECHLNPFLERHGIEVVDTDLGERIVQLKGEPPSHIVLPAIHLKKEEVGVVFHQHLGTDQGASDPNYLTEAARKHLREKFMAAQAGLSGVNFAVAETGGVVVCTNEGNADLGTSLPPLHIACMGIEKLVPRLEDLGLFLRLLARSATGQPITSYTSHFHGPRPGGELHIVLVDNGRSDLLGDPSHRRSLHCIRCGACINTCPVYRRSGGYSYHATIPGPIGSTLGPSRNMQDYYDLPYACSLCGSCTDICPVQINLDEQLLGWRHRIVAHRLLPWRKRLLMKLLSWTFRNTWMYVLAGKVARWTVPWMPRFLIYNPLNAWGKGREIPRMPKHSFREMYRKRIRK